MAGMKDNGTIMLGDTPSSPFVKSPKIAAPRQSTISVAAPRQYRPLTASSQVGKRRYGRNLSVSAPKVKI